MFRKEGTDTALSAATILHLAASSDRRVCFISEVRIGVGDEAIPGQPGNRESMSVGRCPPPSRPETLVSKLAGRRAGRTRNPGMIQYRPTIAQQHGMACSCQAAARCSSLGLKFMCGADYTQSQQISHRGLIHQEKVQHTIWMDGWIESAVVAHDCGAPCGLPHPKPAKSLIQ